MQGKRELLAYCGFYCGDCLGYTGVIADAAQNLMDVLLKYRFDRTAECVFPTQLADYDRLSEMLTLMAELRCPGVCRRPDEDGAPSTCAIKSCCTDRGFYACYECRDFEACDKHQAVHKGLHYEACVKNMRAIRQMGLDAWLAGGPRFCYWMEVNEG